MHEGLVTDLMEPIGGWGVALAIVAAGALSSRFVSVRAGMLVAPPVAGLIAWATSSSLLTACSRPSPLSASSEREHWAGSSEVAKGRTRSIWALVRAATRDTPVK